VIIPDKAENFKRTYWYLISIRGIEPEIVSVLMNEKKVYQEAQYGNCVFVGYDESGIPKYCSMLGTYTDKAFKMDAVNSDKSYPFVIGGKSDMVFVCESPIDAMSHATFANSMDMIGGRITASLSDVPGMAPLNDICSGILKSKNSIRLGQ
jgi:hypothetical protein